MWPPLNYMNYVVELCCFRINLSSISLWSLIYPCTSCVEFVHKWSLNTSVCVQYWCIQKIHSTRGYAMMGAAMLKRHQFVRSLWALYRLVVSSITWGSQAQPLCVHKNGIEWSLGKVWVRSSRHETGCAFLSLCVTSKFYNKYSNLSCMFVDILVCKS